MPRASIVPAFSTVSVTAPLRRAKAAELARYAGTEIGRYQLIMAHTGGTTTSSPAASNGSLTAAATMVNTIVTVHTMIWGMPTRTRNSMRETSLVVRPTRSPVPADSTALRGRWTTRVIMRSRRSAKTDSPSVRACIWAKRLMTAPTTVTAMMTRTIRST